MVWNWMIALYLFLAGMGAGAFVLSGISGMAKKPCPKIKMIGFIAGPVCVAVGALLLVVDAHAGLMNPLRFFYLVSNLGSVMAWGVIILALFIVVAAIDAIIMIVKKSTPRALDIIGMILAVCVAAYTACFWVTRPSRSPCGTRSSCRSCSWYRQLRPDSRSSWSSAHGKAHDEIANIDFTVKSGMVLPVLEALLVIALLGTVAITAARLRQRRKPRSRTCSPEATRWHSGSCSSSSGLYSRSYRRSTSRCRRRNRSCSSLGSQSQARSGS